MQIELQLLFNSLLLLGIIMMSLVESDIMIRIEQIVAELEKRKKEAIAQGLGLSVYREVRLMSYAQSFLGFGNKFVSLAGLVWLAYVFSIGFSDPSANSTFLLSEQLTGNTAQMAAFLTLLFTFLVSAVIRGSIRSYDAWRSETTAVSLDAN